jgi:hypothetical protein
VFVTLHFFVHLHDLKDHCQYIAAVCNLFDIILICTLISVNIGLPAIFDRQCTVNQITNSLNLYPVWIYIFTLVLRNYKILFKVFYTIDVAIFSDSPSSIMDHLEKLRFAVFLHFKYDFFVAVLVCKLK